MRNAKDKTPFHPSKHKPRRDQELSLRAVRTSKERGDLMRSDLPFDREDVIIRVIMIACLLAFDFSVMLLYKFIG